MGVTMAISNPFKGMSKTQRYASIGGASAIGLYMVYHHHKSTGSWNPWSSATSTTAANGTATASGTDPVTGLPYSQDYQIDPLTNLGYLAEAQQYGSIAAAESAVSAYGLSSNTGSGVGVQPATGSQTGTTNTGVGNAPYTSNQAWAQAATAGLADIGYSETDVATALGDYLTETPVTNAQAQLIHTAIAEYGNPPVGTFQVILQPQKPPGPQMVTVPDETGTSQEDAFKHVIALGLKAKGTPVVKGKILYVKSQSPKAGTQVTKGSTVTFHSVLSPPNKHP